MITLFLLIYKLMFYELSSYNYLQCSSKSEKIPIYKEFQNVLDQCYTNRTLPKGVTDRSPEYN